MIQNIMNIGKSGMLANRDAIGILSNNVVNSSTSGYKKLESEFHTLVSHSLDKDSYPNYSKDVATGTGVKMSQPSRNEEQGILTNSGRFADFAIMGEGYFRVIRPDGSYAYTRASGFNVDGRGRLVDDYGNLLEINFSEGYDYSNIDFSSNSENRVNATGTPNTEGIDKDGIIRKNKIIVGKINIYTNVGDNDLYSIRDNLFIPKEGTNMVQSNSAYMRQGYIELSNVNLAEELTNLIKLQRAYQSNGKGITTADEMWALINGM